ncbi:hypothetical protein F938_02048 [Acinetobacter bereziniae LMG 1003 = CIP 70.12]|uniref:Uncharacterized protein n=1 Tax=Acinetobacter bereziniae LMG 1003 = CIP 70.12 TaxID=981324 RepID=N9EP40_ACIBZ|nr:hypothetical protein F938_02048 [Acinetobacter bereziniae LMG 1003 = CIP 70.12]
MPFILIIILFVIFFSFPIYQDGQDANEQLCKAKSSSLFIDSIKDCR